MKTFIKIILGILLLTPLSLKAQKLDQFLSKSYFSISHGAGYDYFAKKAPDQFATRDKDSWGRFTEFEFGFKVKELNEFGVSYGRQVNKRTYNDAYLFNNQVFVSFEDFDLKNIKNFYSVFYKRHLIKDDLIASANLYYLTYSEQSTYFGSNGTQLGHVLSEERIDLEFGLSVGLEYYFHIRNIDLGIKTKAFYTQGYSWETLESFMIAPTVRFNL